MPYHNSQTLLPDPDVKIFLTGQLILKPLPNSSQCDVGVNRCAPGHVFSMEVRQKMKDTLEPDVILWRHVGPLLPGGFEIDKEPATNRGVHRFVPTLSFSRNPTSNCDIRDFRWIVDLGESDEFHQPPVKISGRGTEPNIRIRDGFFYTACLTDPAQVTVKRIRGGQPDWPLYRIASMIGVNVYLAEGEKVKLTWWVTGVAQPLVLVKPNATPDIKNYEIWINNNPIDVNPNSPPPLHELEDYYKVIESVVEGGSATTDFKRFELDFHPPGPPKLGSPTIPCMPVGGGG